jgi:hypothetical protein
MDRRLLNPKIARRALSELKKWRRRPVSPRTSVAPGIHPVLAVQPITSMTGAVRDHIRDRREVR